MLCQAKQQLMVMMSESEEEELAACGRFWLHLTRSSF